MRSIALLTSLLLACGSDTVSTDGGAAGSTSSGSATLDSSTTTRASTSTSTSGADETSQTSVAFVDDDLDAGSSRGECDRFAQDCPPGLKCMPYANGGSSWNAWGCFPVIEDPADPGEPCMVEGSGVSGVDTCAVGSMCWDVDEETLEGGQCVALCIGDESSPFCEEPGHTCVITSEYTLTLCLPTCHPLEDDCAEGEGCYPIGEVLLCAPDGSEAMGSAGDPCEYVNVCDPGTMCADAENVPECNSAAGCCSPFCTIGDDSPCLPGQTCQPWYEPGDAPPGDEDLGACVLP